MKSSNNKSKNSGVTRRTFELICPQFGKRIPAVVLLCLVFGASITRGQIVFALQPQSENQSFIYAEAATDVYSAGPSQYNEFIIPDLSTLNQTETANASGPDGTSSASSTLTFNLGTSSVSSSFNGSTGVTGIYNINTATFGINLTITTTQTLSYNFQFNSNDLSQGIDASLSGGNGTDLVYNSLGVGGPSSGDDTGTIAPGTYSLVFGGGKSGGNENTPTSLNGQDYTGSASISLSFSPSEAPEPSTWAMLLGGVGLFAIRYARLFVS